MRKILWSFFETFETVLIAVVAVFLVRTFIAQPFLVSGSSMEPNFYSGDYLLIDEVAYHFRAPDRGEVIVFKYPGDGKTFYIKRIIGLPGERVVVNDGNITVYSNGQKKALDESYIAKKSLNNNIDVTLELNQFFVMGDNRNASFDSRSWGPLNNSLVVGLARFRLWPLDQATAFAAPAY